MEPLDWLWVCTILCRLMGTPHYLVAHEMQSTMMAAEAVWEYIKMQSREDSLWESFPQTLQSRDGAGRYINAFRAPFQELSPLSGQEVYVL